MDTRDSIIREVTHEYLASVDKSNLPEPNVRKNRKYQKP